jgi:hypothetical protein
MTVGERINAALTAHAGLVALVSTRISAGIAKQGTVRPYLTYQIVGARPEYTHDGIDGEMRDPEFQFDSVGDTYDSARAVNAQLLAALVSAESPVVDLYVMVEDDGTDIYERETGFHRVMTRARVWYRS